MIRRSVPLLLLIAASVTSGCFGGKTPVTTVWSLPTPPSLAPGVDPEGAALGVERFSSNAELRSTALSYREGTGRKLTRYSYQRWSDYPDHLLHERLIAQLLGARAFRSVSDAPPKKGLDAILSVRLVEFDEWNEDSDVSVRVGLRWSLEGPDGELLGTDLAQSSQDAGSVETKDIELVIAAYERATAEVLASISSRVLELLSER